MPWVTEDILEDILLEDMIFTVYWIWSGKKLRRIVNYGKLLVFLGYALRWEVVVDIPIASKVVVCWCSREADVIAF